MRWPWQRRPQRPRGVRVVYPDGRQQRVHVDYAGVDYQEQHVWVAVIDWRGADPHKPLPQVQIDTLPPHTTVNLKVRMRMQRGDAE